MRRAGAALAAVALSRLAVPAAAQPSNRAACEAAFQTTFERAPVGDPCQELAGELILRLTNDFWNEATEDLSPETMLNGGDVRPASSGSASAAGSAGQSEAVPSAQPLGLGGGSISAVGSDAGADAITSLALNPSMFFGHDAESWARYSRLLDLTLFFPVDGLDRDGDGDIDYVGARVRVNFAGISAGDEVWEGATNAFRELLGKETSAAVTLRDRLRTMTRTAMEDCARAIVSALGPEAVDRACGGGFALPSPEEYEAFRRALDVVRTEADSRYFGLDLRMDFGDPTLGAVENADVTALNAGLAFGKQFVGDRPDPMAPSAGVRGRLGLRYADLRDLEGDEGTSRSVDGGLGFLLKRPVSVEQALTLSGGVEFRFGDAEEALEERLQADFLSLRGSISVPISDQIAVSVTASEPLLGDAVSSTLTVTGDWKLRLPGLLQGGR